MHLLNEKTATLRPVAASVRLDRTACPGREDQGESCVTGRKRGPSAAPCGATVQAASSGTVGWDAKTGQGMAPSQGWGLHCRCGRSWRDWRTPGPAGHGLCFRDPEIRGGGPTETSRARKTARVTRRPCSWPVPGALAEGGTERLRNCPRWHSPTAPTPSEPLAPNPQLRWPHNKQDPTPRVCLSVCG